MNSPNQEVNDPLGTPLLLAVAALAASRAEIPALNIYQIDECIHEYESAELVLDAAKLTHAQAKAGLIALVQAQGATPAGADYSKRLRGQHNVATVTVGNTTVVHEQFVDELGIYCAEQRLDSIFDRLFATEIKHRLIDGARSVLATVELPKRVHDKLLSLFGRCFDVTPKAPVLRVEMIEPEKPVRTPRKKAVA